MNSVAVGWSFDDIVVALKKAICRFWVC